jgi:hypothetical protein
MRPSPLIEPPVSSARLLGHGQRLAGEHGFVHLRLPLQQHAVHRQALARAHHQAVAHHHLGHGHVHLAALAQQVRHVRPQAVQRADRRRGLALGAGLQPLAQQHQRDHHRRGLEIQVRRVPRVAPSATATPTAPSPRWCQWPPADPCCRSTPGRVPAGLVETRAQDMNCTGVASANCSQAGSIQCAPNRSPNIGSTSGADSSQADGDRRETRPRATRPRRAPRLAAGVRGS